MLVVPGSFVTNIAPPMLSSMRMFMPASKLLIQPLFKSPMVLGANSLSPAGPSSPMVSQLSNSISGKPVYNSGLLLLPKDDPNGCW